ncbi:hypothetical protein M9458_043318, partial [Cirrhinus mrigala]
MGISPDPEQDLENFLLPLLPVSPSAHPQPTICAVGSPWVCQSPLASWLEDPWSRPLPVNLAAPPWLLAPSSPA